MISSLPPASLFPAKTTQWSERGLGQNPLASVFTLWPPQEGALDLLKKLNSCQMSIQLLQVGWGWEALGALPGWERFSGGKTLGRALGGISEGWVGARRDVEVR